MRSQFKYDYYTISVPGNHADSIKELGGIAIDEARERAKLYCMPAFWTAEHVSGELGGFEVVFRVCRKRYAS